MEKDNKPTVGLVVPATGPAWSVGLVELAGMEALEATRKQLAWDAFAAGTDMDTRDTPEIAFEAWWAARGKP